MGRCDAMASSDVRINQKPLSSQSLQSGTMSAKVWGRGSQHRVAASSQQHLSSVRKGVSSVATSSEVPQTHGGVRPRSDPSILSQGPDGLRRGTDARAAPYTQQDDQREQFLMV